MNIDFYYDIVCPYAYLASTQIEALAERCGARVIWKPFLLGGVFKAIGSAPMESASIAKARHNLLDMQRWAKHWGVPLAMPAGHPRRTVLALRALIAAGEERRPEVTHALYRAYWVDGLDVTAPDVVARVLEAAGADGAACVAAAETPPVKDELRRLTDEAVARGVFGAPSIFVGNEMYWGQDRLQFVEAAVTKSRDEGTRRS